METPKIEKANKSKKNNGATFKLKDKENRISYTFTFSIESNYLIVNIVEDESVPSIKYQEKFSLNDLEKQSRYFKLFESLEEFIP